MDPVLKHKLDKVFRPKSIAIIGASTKPYEFSNWNLKRLQKWEHKDHVYPINPRIEELHGFKVYPDIASVPEKIDLAYICLRAELAIDAMQQCVDAGVESVLVYTSGFAEIGEEGRKLQEELVETARKGGIRFVGPNCFGIYNHTTGMFIDDGRTPGTASIVSHSGGLGTIMSNLGHERGLRFSKTVTCGNQADIKMHDYIEYYGQDPETELILCYMEDVGDGERLFEVVKKVSAVKPVFILKGGRTAAGARAASSHTGALATDFAVFKATMEQAGAILCEDMDELIDFAIAKQMMPLPQGRNVVVVTGPGGVGVLSADAIKESGLECPRLGAETASRLKGFLASFASAANPVDLTTAAAGDPTAYPRTVEVLLEDDDIDTMLLIAGMGPFVENVRELKDKWSAKPFVIGSMSTSEGFSEISATLGQELQVPAYQSSRRAANSLAAMTNYAEYLAKEKAIADHQEAPKQYNKERALEIIAAAKAAGQVMLDQEQAFELMSCYGVPVTKNELAANVDEALAIADQIGYPVVLKVSSEEVIHKSDSGGVALNIQDADELKEAFERVTTAPLAHVPDAKIDGALVSEMVKPQIELSTGLVRDAQFGPIVMFGLGGIFIEVLRDVAMRSAHMSKQDALDMMAEIRSSSILDGPRGLNPVDKDVLADVILGLAALAKDIEAVAEADINPLVSTEKGLVAVDARVKIK